MAKRHERVHPSLRAKIKNLPEPSSEAGPDNLMAAPKRLLLEFDKAFAMLQMIADNEPIAGDDDLRCAHESCGARVDDGQEHRSRCPWRKVFEYVYGVEDAD